jgi:hypothetical protein
MLQNVGGQELDYDAFKAAYDANPAFQQLVDRFDAEGVTIKTKNKMEPAGQRSDKASAQANVMSSAKKAANKLLGK